MKVIGQAAQFPSYLFRIQYSVISCNVNTTVSVLNTGTSHDEDYWVHMAKPVRNYFDEHDGTLGHFHLRISAPQSQRKLQVKQ